MNRYGERRKSGAASLSDIKSSGEKDTGSPARAQVYRCLEKAPDANRVGIGVCHTPDESLFGESSRSITQA